MEKKGLLLVTITCMIISIHTTYAERRAEKRAKKSDDVVEVTITSKIEVNKNVVDESEILREVKEDGKRITKKYAKLRGITKVETRVDADKEKKNQDCGPCKECCKNTKNKSTTDNDEEEEEEDCGCGINDDEEETAQGTQG